jgi:hypothetical protein
MSYKSVPPVAEADFTREELASAAVDMARVLDGEPLLNGATLQ